MAREDVKGFGDLLFVKLPIVAAAHSSYSMGMDHGDQNIWGERLESVNTLPSVILILLPARPWCSAEKIAIISKMFT